MASNLRNVFIVQVEMSSPSKVADTETLDDMHRKTTLSFTPEVREKIKEVRYKARSGIEPYCLPFHGLRVVSAADVPKVQAVIATAKAEMKAIDPTLDATVIPIPLSVDAQARGELYEAIVSSIRGLHDKLLL